FTGLPGPTPLPALSWSGAWAVAAGGPARIRSRSSASTIFMGTPPWSRKREDSTRPALPGREGDRILGPIDLAREHDLGLDRRALRRQLEAPGPARPLGDARAPVADRLAVGAEQAHVAHPIAVAAGGEGQAPAPARDDGHREVPPLHVLPHREVVEGDRLERARQLERERALHRLHVLRAGLALEVEAERRGEATVLRGAGEAHRLLPARSRRARARGIGRGRGQRGAVGQIDTSEAEAHW